MEEQEDEKQEEEWGRGKGPEGERDPGGTGGGKGPVGGDCKGEGGNQYEDEKQEFKNWLEVS